MPDKKTKIILLVCALLSPAVIFFAFKSFIKNPAPDPGLSENNIIKENINEIKEEPEEKKITRLPEETIKKNLAELAASHPELTQSQLDLYGDIALGKSQEDCEGRDDEADCIFATAFALEASGTCGHIEDEKRAFECSDPIIEKTYSIELSKCQTIENEGLKLLCLQNMMALYGTPEECAGLSEEAKNLCQAVTYYQAAVEKPDAKLCENIADEFIKSNCVKHSFNQTIDTDKDGLSDYEEIYTYKTNPNSPDTDKDALDDGDEANTYKTDPVKPDTDNDGFKDGDEVKNGYNPAGEGMLQDGV